MKRGWMRIGTAATLALLMSGCATLVPRGPAPTERPPERPVDRPAPIAPGIPQDNERHRVALLVPMSGQNAGVGQSIANATMLALLDTKSERIRITNYDTAQGAAAAAKPVTRSTASMPSTSSIRCLKTSTITAISCSLKSIP